MDDRDLQRSRHREVVSADGAQLASNDDAGEDRNCRMTVSLSARPPLWCLGGPALRRRRRGRGVSPEKVTPLAAMSSQAMTPCARPTLMNAATARSTSASL